MDLTNEELEATRILREEYEPQLTADELELIKIYRKFTKVEQCVVMREMKAREYLNDNGISKGDL
jgi:hypothetical protein